MVIKKNFFILLFFSFFSMQCSSVPTNIQPQINGLVVAGKFRAAMETIADNQDAYGKNNRLLYDMDYGLILQFAGEYEKSIEYFNRAKRAYDELLTVSLSQEVSTWLVNDYLAPYRGEDFERVMINVFQSLNFASLGLWEEALVEARDVDIQLRLINSQYQPNQKNVYQEDAFARLLMGLLYEAQDTLEGYNDALISYRKALTIYENDFAKNYGLGIPQILKENILAVTQMLDLEEFKEYQEKLGPVKYVSLEEKRQKAQVYLIHYDGLSPIKHQWSLPIPLPNGYVTQLAFPQYDKRNSEKKEKIFKAISRANEETVSAVEKGQDIGAIAVKNLDNRRARVIAKALLRSGAKYFLEQQGESFLKRESGQTSARIFKYLSNLYNITSEQADLRSWQTLPERIEIARLILEPGDYDFFVNQKKIRHFSLGSGDVKFIIYRSAE